jgi:hypothetical protein
MATVDDLLWRTLEDLVRAVLAVLDPVLAGTTGRWGSRAWIGCANGTGSNWRTPTISWSASETTSARTRKAR